MNANPEEETTTTDALNDTPQITQSGVLPQVAPASPSNALAIWALVTGLLCCAPVGIVLGIIGLTKYKQGTSGWVMSLIALVVSILGIIGNTILYIANPTQLQIP